MTMNPEHSAEYDAGYRAGLCKALALIEAANVRRCDTFTILHREVSAVERLSADTRPCSPSEHMWGGPPPCPECATGTCACGRIRACETASCVHPARVTSPGVPAGGEGSCPGSSGPAPKHDRGYSWPTIETVDLMLAQLERDRKTAYWGTPPHSESLDGAEAWLQSLREWLPATSVIPPGGTA